MANTKEGGRAGEISVSFDTLNGGNLHITDAKIPPWPPPPPPPLDERGEFDRKSSYTPLYRVALKLTAAPPPTTTLTLSVLTTAAFCMGIIKS